MDLLHEDTIAALASAPGSSARGIVRVSGAETVAILNASFRPDDRELWEQSRLPRRHEGVFEIAGESHGMRPVGVDAGMFPMKLPVDVHLWPGTRSYTRQPTAEVHTVGSPPLLEAVLGELYRHGARPAQRGEFTLRAFLAGRIDLMQAEAVLGVIDSSDQETLQQALRQLAGGISGRIAALHDELLNLLADLEAGLDFVEEDIAFVSRDEVVRRLRFAGETLEDLLARSGDRMLSTTRVRVVLAGLPNVGKSTLFNALSRGSSALVSEQSGTTRDYLRSEIDWNGLPVELVDTAGWDFDAAGIAASAQHLRDEQFQQADVIVWCTPVDSSPEERRLDAELRRRLPSHSAAVLFVQTKADLLPSTGGPELRLSAIAGRGLDALQRRIEAIVSDTAEGTSVLGTTAARCRDSLRRAVESLQRAAAVAQSQSGDELIAAEIREAIDALGQIVGTVYTDDLLDRIFSKFCIGK